MQQATDRAKRMIHLQWQKVDGDPEYYEGILSEAVVEEGNIFIIRVITMDERIRGEKSGKFAFRLWAGFEATIIDDEGEVFTVGIAGSDFEFSTEEEARKGAEASLPDFAATTHEALQAMFTSAVNHTVIREAVQGSDTVFIMEEQKALRLNGGRYGKA